ncbi:MAG: hypothetical protein Q7R84_00565 [bacterium]|nr:hypothetical protein [bacterium]
MQNIKTFLIGSTILNLALIALASFLYFKLPPVKYWDRQPQNFTECAEASRGFIIKTLPVQCEFRGQRFFDESKGKTDILNILNHLENDPESPEIKVSGDITTFVKSFLEPAPTGYKWEYSLDWDKTIINKCLVNAKEKDGSIDDAVYQKIKLLGQPSGYWWITEQKLPPTPGPNINIKLCLSRLECPYGKIPNSRECIVPQ